MATRNQRKLAALNKENCEEHPRSNLVSNSNVPRSQEDYITQVSAEEIEGRVTKKLSQEFSRTENCILGALARLDDFLMNPLLQGHSGTTPETSRNVFSINQGTNEDDSQSDPHPEVGLLTSGREDRHDIPANESCSQLSRRSKTIQILALHPKRTFTRPPIYDEAYPKKMWIALPGNPVGVTKPSLITLYVQPDKKTLEESTILQ